MIQLNNTTLNKQPSNVTENLIPIQTDVGAIDGSQQRNFIQNKWGATMKWSMLLPADYWQIINIITNGLVVYYNNLSNEVSSGPGVLTFTGLCTFKETPYAPGASAVRDLEVTIRQA